MRYLELPTGTKHPPKFMVALKKELPGNRGIIIVGPLVALCEIKKTGQILQKWKVRFFVN